MTVPDWVDWDRIQRGQQVFWRYCLFISNALVHFSLTNGFSVSKVMKVMNSTGYLSGDKNKKRILETAQFVFDVVHSIDYLQPGSGLAWKSIIQIRLLHADVRARLLKIGRAHPKYYNLQDYGVPINQEDQLGTLYSLSSTIWRVMEQRQNVQMTTQERGDYLHVWRYVGYMMGMDDLLGVTETPERADACVESIRLHLESPDLESGRLVSTMFHNIASQSSSCFKITKAVGLLDTYYLHMALAEHLFGSELWEVNGLPPMTWPYRVMKWLIYSLMDFDLWLITMSPRWFRFRSGLLRERIAAIMAKDLGPTRTKFVLKAMPTNRCTLKETA
ncbi:hypothetical protein BGZ75_002869 [Mortierella antarctica]|nr:hypothetical protein BGZ67_004282 [Mortierella alpina]KAF9991241.1 hypothetical protein BGZ75_002869 [Mortierella antarctica]